MQSFLMTLRHVLGECSETVASQIDPYNHNMVQEQPFPHQS